MADLSSHNKTIVDQHNQQAEGYARLSDSLGKGDRSAQLRERIGAGPDDEVLDVACGPGRISLDLAGHGPHRRAMDRSGHFPLQRQDQVIRLQRGGAHQHRRAVGHAEDLHALQHGAGDLDVVAGIAARPVEAEWFHEPMDCANGLAGPVRAQQRALAHRESMDTGKHVLHGVRSSRGGHNEVVEQIIAAVEQHLDG